MPPTYFGRSVNPVDNGSLNALTVTTTPPASMLEGDLIYVEPVSRSVAGDEASWVVAAAGGQFWRTVGGPLAGYGTVEQRWWATFNGTWEHNKLTANQASLETDTTGWQAIANCSITRSSAAGAQDGSWALRMNSSAAGDMDASTFVGASGILLQPAKGTIDGTTGRPYTAIAYVKAGSVSRTVVVAVDLYDATGAFVATFSGSAADSTSSWTKIVVSGFYNPTYVYATVRIRVVGTAGAGELHYVDAISLHYGLTDDFFLPSTIYPVFDTQAVAARPVSLLMLVFRPSAQFKQWRLENQTFQFAAGDSSPYHLTIPSQTVSENDEVCLAVWHRDFVHTMSLVTAGWLNPNSETQWRNDVGVDNEVLLSAGYRIHGKGTTGDISATAGVVSYQTVLYAAFAEVWDKPEQHVRPKRLARSTRW